jgi:hypothetical protein
MWRFTCVLGGVAWRVIGFHFSQKCHAGAIKYSHFLFRIRRVETQNENNWRMIMAFFIKEWPNKTATLMADNGAVLWTFPNVEEAQRVCRDWYSLQAASGSADTACLDPLVATCAIA